MKKQFTVQTKIYDVSYTILFTGIQAPKKNALLCSYCSKPAISIFVNEIISIDPEVKKISLINEIENHLKKTMIKPAESCQCGQKRKLLILGLEREEE